MTTSDAVTIAILGVIVGGLVGWILTGVRVHFIAEPLRSEMLKRLGFSPDRSKRLAKLDDPEDLIYVLKQPPWWKRIHL